MAFECGILARVPLMLQSYSRRTHNIIIGITQHAINLLHSSHKEPVALSPASHAALAVEFETARPEHEG